MRRRRTRFYFFIHSPDDVFINFDFHTIPQSVSNFMTHKTLTLLCLSHLPWEHRLFQRPQQLMTRFEALGHRVLYLSLISSRRWLADPKESRGGSIGTTGQAINRPFIPLSGRFQTVAHRSRMTLGSYAQKFLHDAPAGSPRVVWLQHPGFLPLAERLPHDLLVYDCMDPFSAFQQSHTNVLDQENRLLERADLVFTGGHSLHRQREGRNSHLYCFPSGIDFPHFARAAEEGPLPEDLKTISPPVLGYFGAIDERIDWELIRAVCRARPEWSIVFLGPLLGMPDCPVDAPNFHHLGAKHYETLPEYLRGFTVALIPWLVNDLTRFMSPTKTPEYLAAGRPVVSTPIPDVANDYASEVHIAADAESFMAACAQALETGVGPARKPPQARTWDETAQEMGRLIGERLHANSY